MIKSCSIILPNQLFKESLFHKKNYKVFLLEEFLFFKQYKFHKQKISFHRATMKFYEDYLKEFSCDVEYVNSFERESNIKDLVKKINDFGYKIIEIYDPVDYLVTKRIKEACSELDIKLIIHDTNLFINSSKDLNVFFKDSKKKFFQTSFYKSERKKRNILIDSSGKPKGGEWTYDILNRKKFPKDEIPPEIRNPKKNKYVLESEKYVLKYFKDNLGSLGEFNYPTTIDESEKWFKDFLIERFNNFGDYEDAIVKDELTLNHSILSPLINVGFINPRKVIQDSLDFSEEHEIPINSTEGFIRQILGWREFIRGIYQLRGSEQKNSNFWGHQRKLSQSWYDGSTGLLPLDDCIKSAVKDGYSHHIPRLMVICNLMNMCEIDPKIIYKWFMEMYIDASDWVMIPNVFGMATYSDGGLMSTKPYTCSSNYILKMSNYEKGAWCDVIDGLYWRFIQKNIEFYSSNPRLSFQTRVLSRMSEDRKAIIFKKAEEFLEIHTQS